MNLRKPLKITLSAVLLAYSSTNFAENAFSVACLLPSDEYDPFHIVVRDIMQAAADDLEIGLEIAYGKSSTIRLKREGLKLLRGKPDYFLTGYFTESTSQQLKDTSTTGTKVFLISSEPDSSGYEEIGQPRKKHQHWIGQLTPDDKHHGYVLADELIQRAKKAGLTNKDGKVNIIALGGNDDDHISGSRIEGLKTRIRENNDAVLQQTVLSAWKKDTAYRNTLDLLEQYPDTHVVWAISDTLAAGGIQAAEEMNRLPGKDILFGGINLGEYAIENIGNGKQSISVGGHFLEAAWSLVMLYDYHHGADFANNTGFVFHSEPYILTADNISTYKNFFLNSDWDKIDFRWFSKKLNPDISEYNFSVTAFQKIIKEHTAREK